LKEVTRDNILDVVYSLSTGQVTVFNDLLQDADLLTQLNPKQTAKRFFKEKKRLHKGKVKQLLAYIAKQQEAEILELLEAFFDGYTKSI